NTGAPISRSRKVPPPTPVTSAKKLMVTNVCRSRAACSAPVSANTAVPPRSSSGGRTGTSAGSTIAARYGLNPSLAMIQATGGGSPRGDLRAWCLRSQDEQVGAEDKAAFRFPGVDPGELRGRPALLYRRMRIGIAIRHYSSPHVPATLAVLG